VIPSWRKVRTPTPNARREPGSRKALNQ
jgi:hypothetical protein